MSTEKKIYGFHSITSQIRLDPLVIKEVFIDEARSDGRNPYPIVKVLSEPGSSPTRIPASMCAAPAVLPPTPSQKLLAIL